MVQDKKITLDDISRGIDKGLNTADGNRAATLERLQTVRNAKAASLRKEQARLTLKYGADHPRVQALAGRAALNQGLISDLAFETTRAKTEIPVVDEVTWVLHGYVRDRGGNGLPKLTIALYDHSERTANWLKDLGYACTNDKGYFKLEAHNLKDHASAPVFLRVLNSGGATIYIDPHPLTPKGGQVDYRQIVIGGEAMDCQPPPPPTPSTAQWIVRGNVADGAGSPLPLLTVTIADKGGKFADRLGKTQTGIKGEFGFAYPADAFADLIKQPVDLFLQVLDSNLRPIYTHSQALHFEPGKIATIPIVIDKKTLRLTGKS